MDLWNFSFALTMKYPKVLDEKTFRQFISSEPIGPQSKRDGKMKSQSNISLQQTDVLQKYMYVFNTTVY